MTINGVIDFYGWLTLIAPLQHLRLNWGKFIKNSQKPALVDFVLRNCLFASYIQQLKTNDCQQKTTCAKVESCKVKHDILTDWRLTNE